MTKHMDKLYKSASWIVMIALLTGYFAYMVLEPTGSIEQTVNDWRSWLHIIFVVFINNTMVSSAFDSATSYGIRSDEFTLADKLNNKIITSVNNEMEDFRLYAKKLNEHELQSIRDDYLFSIGDKTLDNLTEKERKAYDNLKPVQHNIYGFNLPLYYETTKSGKVEYQASMKKNQGKTKKKITKSIAGIMFGAMTVNVGFSANNVGDALVSVLIIAVGLIVTFLMIFFPQAFKFKYDMPQKVILKNTFYEGYIEHKNGTHKLKALIDITNNEKVVKETDDKIIEENKELSVIDPIHNNGVDGYNDNSLVVGDDKPR